MLYAVAVVASMCWLNDVVGTLLWGAAWSGSPVGACAPLAWVLATRPGR